MKPKPPRPRRPVVAGPFAAAAFATAALAASVAIAAAPAASVTAPGTASVTTGDPAAVAAVRAVGERWKALYGEGRYAEIPELYTVDAVVMPRGRPRIEGREQLRRSIGGLAAGRRVDIEVTEREIAVDGDLAWYVGDFRVTYTPAEPGAAPKTEFGRSLIVFRRDADGQWRVHRDIDSPAPAPAVPAPPVWDPKSRTEPTECDRLASGRYDRHRLAKPKARDEIDVPAAIRLCEADLAKLPGDPRLHFHLGRLYGYAGDREKSRYHREAAAAAGDPNAIFLLGYLAWAEAKDDPARCAAARRMKLAADRGNYSGRLAYAAFALEGRFAACPDAGGPTDWLAYARGAQPEVDGFFEKLLADHLVHEAGLRVGARP